MKSLDKIPKGSDKLTSVYKLEADIRKTLKGTGKKKVAIKTERQGPTDWSHLGLKSKYRGATEREDAWNLWLKTSSFSKQYLEEAHGILPVVKMERHPIYRMYHQQLEEEITISNTRTRNRLLMKRFVFDIQEIWLANLQHLKEHQPAHMETGDGVEQSEDYARGDGIADRRDVRAIVGLDHQIQSVSQKRVFANAYHTSRLPPIQVVLDYKPLPPPLVAESRPSLPTVQLLLHDIMFHASEHDSKLFVHSPGSLSTARAIVLRIDRLIPSYDLITHNVLPDILWRFTLVDSLSLQQRVCLCTETNVASFVTNMITSSMSQPAPERIVLGTYRSDHYVPLPFEDKSVEWEGQVEVVVSQNASPNASKALHAIGISITAFLRPFTPSSASYASPRQQDIVMSLQCSPAELNQVLATPHAPLYDAKYWTDEARLADSWIPLCSCLALEAETGISNGLRRMPVGIQLDGAAANTKAEKFFSRVEGALTDLQALSCAYEVMNSLRLISDSTAPLVTPPVLQFLQEMSMLQMVFDEVDEDMLENIGPDEEDYTTPQEMRDRIHELAFSGQWEALHRTLPMCLSMQAGDLIQHVHSVPGACMLGAKGLWFPDAVDPWHESTQVAAHYFRDADRSTTNSIMVNMLLALDTMILTAVQTAWENFSQKVQPYPGEESDGVVPMTAVKRLQILQEPLQSPIQQRRSQSIIIFTASAVEGIDYTESTNLHIPPGCRRYVPTKNEYGYREQIEVKLLDVDSHVATQIFGITRTGAIANNTFVNARNIWHNVIAITEHINRPRLPKDYHYILFNPDHSGSNQPSSYTTRMRAHEMVGLTSSAFKLYEDAYMKIMELRDVFHKQLALDQRIERLENEVKIKENMRIRQIQSELQRALEKRMKKITKSEAGWRRRLQGSILIEVQGNWERRRDAKGGLIFFHAITPLQAGHAEQCSNTCQWEVPASWDGSALWTEQDPALFNQHASMVASLRTGQASLSTSGTMAEEVARRVHEGKDKAFLEPSSSWAPYADTKMNNTHNNAQLLSQPVMSVHNRTQQSTNLIPAPSRSHVDSVVVSQQRRNSQDSAVSDLDSVAADRSLQESSAPTIDTVNLEHIAEQLLSSDELMRVLAKRLGLSEAQVVPADELSSVFSVYSNKPGKNNNTLNGVDRLDDRLPAPRDPYNGEQYEPEFDSDDDLWSDDEEEVGDFDMQKEIASDDMIPQDQLQAANLQRKENGFLSRGQDATATSSIPKDIPFLDFTNVHEKSHRNEQFIGEKYGWRRLPRPVLKEGFLAAALKTHTRGPDIGAVNTINTPVFLLPISPVDACKYTPANMDMPVETIFIPNAKRDLERCVANLQRNIKREQDLSRNVPTDDLLLTGEVKEFTSIEQFLNKQYKVEKAHISDPQEAAQEKAILAAKSSNMPDMEDAWAADIPINTRDEYGNTLLILAGQQGDKKMCKFLLAKGADLNLQNLVGNTVLHYCYAYSKDKLASYLISKGADDSLLNVDGLTCYEGLNRLDMDQQYGDYTEEDFNRDDEEQQLQLENSTFSLVTNSQFNNSYSDTFASPK